MRRNEFLFAWLMVVTLLLMGILVVTLVFVWRSGLLSGEVPLVASTADPAASVQRMDLTGNNPLLKATDSFNAKVFCVDPATSHLVPEDRTIAGAPHNLMRSVLNVIEALRSPPSQKNLQPAVPPEIQFRTCFLDRDTRTLYIDIAHLPESWNNSDPIQVGSCLYAIVHTVTGLGSDFQYVRFLVDGKEPETSPGGIILSEAFSPSEDWIGAQTTQ